MSSERSSGLDLIGWILGLAGLVLVFVGFLVVDHGGWLGPDSPVRDLAAEITSNQTRIVAGSTMGIVGGLVLVGFVAALRMRLARQGSKGEFLGLVAYAFGLVMVIGAFVHGSFRMATSAPIEPNMLADAVLPLSILKEHVTDLLMIGILGVAATMSISSLVMRLLPKAVAWIGIGLVVINVILIPTNLGVGGLAMYFWLMGACFMLIAQDGAALTGYVRRSADPSRRDG
jgi:hypothetical protein